MDSQSVIVENVYSEMQPTTFNITLVQLSESLLENSRFALLSPLRQAERRNS